MGSVESNSQPMVVPSVDDDGYEGPSFFWYDLETSGTDPRWDRIVQVAGLRTDMALNEIGRPIDTYVHLPDDVLPNPDATLVTGITPARTRTGIDEWQAAQLLQTIFSKPGTCGVGYNSLRFDDEFVRFAFYRTLHDPYAREWQHGNSRWDLIDLVRATGALRRDGLAWPTLEGDPSFKLELMAEANHIEHGQAHDALSDVRATLGLARLIREKQPKLFAYYFENRFKKRVRRLLEPFGARLCVHVSGMYPRARYCLAPVVSVCRHPSNANSIVVADLSQDIEPLLTLSAEELQQRLFKAGGEERPPLKEVRVNRCPFVAGSEVLNDENLKRLDLNMRVIQKRWHKLRQPGLWKKISRIYERPPEPGGTLDADAALYGGFLRDDDRQRCAAFREQLGPAAWPSLPAFSDTRLATLAARLKARAFPQLLTPEEQGRWHAFVTDKLGAHDSAWLALPAFFARLAELEAETPSAAPLLAELRAHGDALAHRYGVGTAAS